MKGKKGAEMTIGTIVIIILALAVLVFLIYGFTVGWGNLWDKITNMFGGKANVQTIVSACKIACSTDAKYDYCKIRKVTFDDGKEEPMNCHMLEDKNVDLSCPSITCDVIEVCEKTDGSDSNTKLPCKCGDTICYLSVKSKCTVADGKGTCS